MGLIDIKNHMVQVKIATLGSLCHFFHVDADTLRCMLKHWINKGKIRPYMKKSACGSQCFQCPSFTTEMYEWVSV